jgi:hypothetical protein
MNQNRTREEIIEKIRRLREIRTDRGATPQEAEAAAAHAERLLHAYQLRTLDLEAGQFGEEIAEQQMHPGGKRIENWQSTLAAELCWAYECRLIIRKQDGSLTFVGHTSDVQIARYLFDLLSRVLWDAATEEAVETGLRGSALTRFRNAYIIGAAESIGRRIASERQAREETETPETLDRSHALVRVKVAKLDSWLATHYPHIRSSRTSGPSNSSGFQAGQAAGHKVQLRPGIERQSGSKRVENRK